MKKSNQLPTIHENEFTEQVLELALLYGYKRAHFRPARTKDGWRTAVSGDGKGFPDLLLVRKRDGRKIAAELKVGKNKPTPEQLDWLETLAACGFETFLWYETDWEILKNILF
jgi:hypothetical protein